MAQAVHAALEFQAAHPALIDKWRESNYLVIVAVPDEHELMKLGSEACHRNLALTLTIEPDIGDQLTAITLQPGLAAQKLCATLPLALKSTP